MLDSLVEPRTISLKGSVDQSHNSLIQSAKKQVEGELTMAKAQYKQAYDSGEPDAILEAQTALNTAQIRMERVNGLKPKQIQALQAVRNSCTTAGKCTSTASASVTKKQNHGAMITLGLGPTTK
jgi:hypothetical protein